jgi:hypothetical protein
MLAVEASTKRTGQKPPEGSDSILATSRPSAPRTTSGPVESGPGRPFEATPSPTSEDETSGQVRRVERPGEMLVPRQVRSRSGCW